jgi:hypothetical protein
MTMTRGGMGGRERGGREGGGGRREEGQADLTGGTFTGAKGT